MIKHMIIQVSHTLTSIKRAHTKVSSKYQERQRSKTLSLEAYDLYISPPLATSYQKIGKCIVLCVSLGLIFGRWCREDSKDEGISWCRWSWWSGCWSWWHWSCSWCRWSCSGVCNMHYNRSLSSGHSSKSISGRLALLLLHFILKLLNNWLYLCDLHI